MVSLLDIAPATETVSVAGKDIPVFAISAKSVASIMRRFPEVAMLLSGKAEMVDTNSFYDLAPNAIAAVIAAGVGSPDSKEFEEKAATLSLDQQLDLLEAILRLTIPGGLRPFAEKLQRMGVVASRVEGPSGKGVDTKSPKPSSD